MYSVYFALAGMNDLFHYLYNRLADILILVGIKMKMNNYYDAKIISTVLSPILIVLILAAS